MQVADIIQNKRTNDTSKFVPMFQNPGTEIHPTHFKSVAKGNILAVTLLGRLSITFPITMHLKPPGNEPRTVCGRNVLD